MVRQLSEYLDASDILALCPSACRPRYEGEVALTAMVDDLLLIMDEGQPCMLILLHLSTAFYDTIDHEAQLVKGGGDIDPWWLLVEHSQRPL